jgi:hypothetical protein
MPRTFLERYLEGWRWRSLENRGPRHWVLVLASGDTVAFQMRSDYPAFRPLIARAQGVLARIDTPRLSGWRAVCSDGRQSDILRNFNDALEFVSAGAATP